MHVSPEIMYIILLLFVALISGTFGMVFGMQMTAEALRPRSRRDQDY